VYRPLLSFWWVFWPMLFLIPVGVTLGMALDKPEMAGLAGAAAAAPLAGPGYLMLRRLTDVSRRFRRMANGRIVVHYAGCVYEELAHAWLTECSNIVERLDRQFGRPIRRRVAVYVLTSRADVGHVGAVDAGAFALPKCNAIVASAADLLHWDVVVREILSHELGHLYSHRLNPSAPAWLSEGLSVWLQETNWGRAVDDVARSFAIDGGPPLITQLKRRDFYQDPHRNYALAGSFVGDLIRRHGWPAFQRLYRGYGGFRTSRTVFRRCLGIDFDTAVRQWQGELLMPDAIRRRLGRNLGEPQT